MPVRRSIAIPLVILTIGIATATVAACGSALVKRNHAIGQASRQAPKGVTLILSTNKITQPAYALCAAAGGLVVNAIFLLLAVTRPQTLTPFLRKIFFLNPLFMLFNTILLIATAIPVTLEGRNGKIHSYIAAGGVQLPSSVFEKQAAALGLAINYWDLGYIKFLVIIPWVCLTFAIIATYISITTWLKERPSAQGHQYGHNAAGSPPSETAEKAHVVHSEHVSRA